MLYSAITYNITLLGNIRNGYTDSIDKLIGKKFLTSCFDLSKANAKRI